MHKEYKIDTDEKTFFKYSGGMCIKQVGSLQKRLSSLENLLSLQLIIYGSEFNSQCCVFLKKILDENSQLHKLTIDLNRNSIRNEGLNYIAIGISKLHNLKVLSLQLKGPNGLAQKNSCIETFFESFVQRKDIIDFSIEIGYQQYFRVKETKTLLKSIQNNKNLINLSINIASNQFSQECFQYISNFTKLIRLRLNFNLYCSINKNYGKDEVFLLSSLQNSPYLRELHLFSECCCYSQTDNCMINAIQSSISIVEQIFLQNDRINTEPIQLNSILDNKYEYLESQKKFYYQLIKGSYLQLYLEAQIIKNQRSITLIQIQMPKLRYHLLKNISSIGMQLSKFKHLTFILLKVDNHSLAKSFKKECMRKNIRLVYLKCQ